MPPSATPAPQQIPVAKGELCSRDLCLSRDDIAAFARLTGDSNPVHHDLAAAQSARHGQIIASAQQVTSMLIGLAATHFSRPADGFGRELLCLNFNFAFKAPVFADQPLCLSWRVASLDWNDRLEGWLVHADGQACDSQGQPTVVGRGTLLVKAVPTQPPA